AGGSMSKVRIYEVAKELGMEQKAVVALFQSMGFGEVRNHMSSVEPEVVERVRRHIEKQKTSPTVEERIRPTVVKRRAVVPRSTGAPREGDGAAAPSVSAPPAPVVPPSSESVAAVAAKSRAPEKPTAPSREAGSAAVAASPNAVSSAESPP